MKKGFQPRAFNAAKLTISDSDSDSESSDKAEFHLSTERPSPSPAAASENGASGGSGVLRETSQPGLKQAAPPATGNSNADAPVTTSTQRDTSLAPADLHTAAKPASPHGSDRGADGDEGKVTSAAQDSTSIEARAEAGGTEAPRQEAEAAPAASAEVVEAPQAEHRGGDQPAKESPHQSQSDPAGAANSSRPASEVPVSTPPDDAAALEPTPTRAEGHTSSAKTVTIDTDEPTVAPEQGEAAAAEEAKAEEPEVAEPEEHAASASVDSPQPAIAEPLGDDDHDADPAATSSPSAAAPPAFDDANECSLVIKRPARPTSAASSRSTATTSRQSVFDRLSATGDGTKRHTYRKPPPTAETERERLLKIIDNCTFQPKKYTNSMFDAKSRYKSSRPLESHDEKWRQKERERLERNAQTSSFPIGRQPPSRGAYV